MCCVGSGRCDEVVTLLEESHRVCVDCVLSGDLKMSGLEPRWSVALQKSLYLCSAPEYGRSSVDLTYRSVGTTGKDSQEISQ